MTESLWDHGSQIGYVVVEFNQASGLPRLAWNGDVYSDPVDAEKDAHGLRADLRANHRKERVGVAKVVMFTEATEE